MKKLISGFLCTVFVLFALASCSDTPPSTTATLPPSSTLAEKTEPFIPNGIEGMDFKGAEINFIMCGDNDSLRNIHLPEKDDETYIVNVCVALRNKKIQENLNIKIGKSIVVPPEEMTEHMRQFFASPNKEYDIVGGYECYDLGLTSGTNEGFIDYNTIHEDDMHIDLDAHYWDKNFYEATSVDGKNYWVTGDISFERTRNTLVSFINKKLWTENSEKIEKAIGYTDLYQLVCDGKWTYETVAQLGGIALYEPGNEKNVFPSILMAGEGIRFSKNGNADFNTNAISAFSDNLSSLFADNGIFKNEIIDASASVTPVEYFSTGTSLITFGTVEMTQSLPTKSLTDYYIAPLPKSEQNAPYRTSAQGQTNVFGILNTCESIGAATATLEAMAGSAGKLLNLEYILSCVPLCYCHDSDDMKDLALYTLNNVEYVTDIAVSCEDMLEEGITDFINNNIFKDDFKSSLNDKKTSFDTDFEKIKNAVLK